MRFFALENTTNSDTNTLTYCCYSIWFLSLFLFTTFIFTALKSNVRSALQGLAYCRQLKLIRRRAATLHNHPSEGNQVKRADTRQRTEWKAVQLEALSKVENENTKKLHVIHMIKAASATSVVRNQIECAVGCMG